ncbi:hypothetical protein BHE74_00030894 [Ensete ventricosum]|nr:hypothetical protein GW17_00028179 [Ensete ventricosum]RWW62004.1 hypothetical protein BHE74_00030894 [Ensete ventricosum]
MFAIHRSLPSTTIAVTAVEPPGPKCFEFSRMDLSVEQNRNETSGIQGEGKEIAPTLMMLKNSDLFMAPGAKREPKETMANGEGGLRKRGKDE